MLPAPLTNQYIDGGLIAGLTTLVGVYLTGRMRQRTDESQMSKSLNEMLNETIGTMRGELTDNRARLVAVEGEVRSMRERSALCRCDDCPFRQGAVAALTLRPPKVTR